MPLLVTIITGIARRAPYLSKNILPAMQPFASRAYLLKQP